MPWPYTGTIMVEFVLEGVETEPEADEGIFGRE
jgi:hypothetical protein